MEEPIGLKGGADRHKRVSPFGQINRSGECRSSYSVAFALFTSSWVCPSSVTRPFTNPDFGSRPT